MTTLDWAFNWNSYQQSSQGNFMNIIMTDFSIRLPSIAMAVPNFTSLGWYSPVTNGWHYPVTLDHVNFEKPKGIIFLGSFWATLVDEASIQVWNVNFAHEKK
jgi:hypothetical protein